MGCSPATSRPPQKKHSSFSPSLPLQLHCVRAPQQDHRAPPTNTLASAQASLFNCTCVWSPARPHSTQKNTLPSAQASLFNCTVCVLPSKTTEHPRQTL